MNIQEFCDRHSACADGREWALANCTDMQDAWNKLQPKWLIWVATREGVLTNKELRLFAVFCARQVEHFLLDERSKNAIEVAERFANGQATGEELAAAWVAAYAAYAARDAAYAAGAAVAAARDSAYAARAAAWAADRDVVAAARDSAYAARAAAWAAAWAAARDSARDAQADWLLKNTEPNFGIEVTE